LEKAMEAQGSDEEDEEGGEAEVEAVGERCV
jgi:hypothetical protein